MAKRKAPASQPAAATPVRGAVLARQFLPSLDLVDAAAERLEELSDADKRHVLETKVADVTHFRVGLDSLQRHAVVARVMAADVRPLPRQVRGVVVNPGGAPAVRVSVQPTLPTGGATIGRGVVTDELGVFALPIPGVSDEQRKVILDGGLGLQFTGRGNARQQLTVPVPDAGSQALGQLTLAGALEPLPESVVAALIDLVGDLPLVTPGTPSATPTPAVKVQIGEGACHIVFEEDVTLRRFPYQILVRLIEPRTTTVNRVFFPDGRFFDRGGNTRVRFAMPLWNTGLVSGFDLKNTRFVERVPIDKPISVDGFRDQVIGLEGATIGIQRTVPMAGTLGLGYVLNLAQVWKYAGLTLGNLVYSLPLAPGEQQRIVVSERVATAAVSDTERLDIAERQHSSLRENTSAQATFDSAFEEHVNASSSYRNEARSSSWGVAGGIGAVLGPVAFGIGAGGAAASRATTAACRARSTGCARSRARPPSRCIAAWSARRPRAARRSGRRSGWPPKPTARP